MKPEEEMEQQLPPGISESGEVVDMAVYEAWQREQNPDIQQKMQRREEVNINVHRERGRMLSREMISDEQVSSSLQFSDRPRSNSRVLLVTIISPRLRA